MSGFWKYFAWKHHKHTVFQAKRQIKFLISSLILSIFSPIVTPIDFDEVKFQNTVNIPGLSTLFNSKPVI